jgi:Ser/Thr protein kinase RdoA (MazF antagonist)
MTTQAKTHGMDGTLVDPDWPPLTLDEVRAVLANFKDAREPVRIVSVSPRPFSAASVIATRDGCVFVKRHHQAVRNIQGLLEEHRFMAHLRAQGAAVPRVFATPDGETAIELNEWTYEVHETPAGVDLYEDALSWTPFRSVEHAHSAGEALARLHHAASGYSAPPRRPRPLVASFTIFAAENPCKALEQYLQARPALDANAATRRSCIEALGVLAPFHAELVPLLPALNPLWTHNDLHASNLFWSDATDSARATSVIDFGLADITNAVYDLAQAIERNIVEWLFFVQDPAHPEKVPIHFDHLYALLEGYESVRALSAAEAAALLPMTALCHAEFALTETDYFLSVLHSVEKAHVASYDYLVGHAWWFRSKGGRMLMEALRKWAAKRDVQVVRG